MIKRSNQDSAADLQAPTAPLVSLIEKNGPTPPTANVPVAHTQSKDSSLDTLRELLEKNLKWSQIIYEQNRKINRKLFWSSAAEWIRTIVIVVPIILALWYLPSAYQNFKTQYGSWLENAAQPKTTNQAAIDQLLKVLPLGDAEKAQLKNLLK